MLQLVLCSTVEPCRLFFAPSYGVGPYEGSPVLAFWCQRSHVKVNIQSISLSPGQKLDLYILKTEIKVENDIFTANVSVRINWWVKLVNVIRILVRFPRKNGTIRWKPEYLIAPRNTDPLEGDCIDVIMRDVQNVEFGSEIRL